MLMNRRSMTLFIAGVIICSGSVLSAFPLPAEARAAVHWADPVLKWMQQSKIMVGDGKGNLMPDKAVTEAELMTMLAKLKRANLSEDESYSTKPLTRGQMIARLSEELQLDAGKLLSGYGDGAVKKERLLTRAEMAVVLKKALGDRVIVGEHIKDKTFAGNLVVASGNVQLENVTVKGNLYLTEAIQNHEAFLKNVTVQGKVLVEGGGSNSIYLESSNINELVLMKKGEPVNVVFSGNTRVMELNIRAYATLQISESVQVEKVLIAPHIESLQINKQTQLIDKNSSQLTLGKRQVPKSTSVTSGQINSKPVTVDTVTHATSKTNVPNTGGPSSSNGGNSSNSGNSGSNGSSSGSHNGSNAGKPDNTPEPEKPKGYTSNWLALDKVKWLDIEGTKYFVLAIKQGILTDYQIILDGQTTIVSPVNAEKTVGKIEWDVLPKTFVVKSLQTGETEVFDVKKLLQIEQPKPELITSIEAKDLNWQNTLQEGPDNTGIIDGLIKIILPKESSAKFELDAVSGATVKGSTPEVYVGNLPEGIRAQVSVDAQNPQQLNISLKGQALKHTAADNRTLVIKLLGKAIKGSNVWFKQIDQNQPLAFDQFGPKPEPPVKPTGNSVIRTEQLTIEGVPYYVIVLTEPKKPQDILKYDGIERRFTPVNAEGTIWKYEIGSEE